MSGPTKVIVVDPDPRAARQLRLGLSREGVEAVVVEAPADGKELDLPKTGVGVVLVGGADGVAVELVRQARAQLKDVPIVFAGTGAGRSALHAAGADEVIEKPAFLRDVVTVARILSGVASDERDHIVGSLAETTGVFTLVRALSALGRSAVLTLIRGLRRGEVRFYRGEVTSAQVGLIHGQAAFHQLLLWTDARFDFAHEDIVRRQQIPLSSDELFADAERFLDGVRESAGGLSPAMILEQDVTRVQNLGKQIPTEVHGVLRMFDGHRVLADVLEDSPYRVFETLRVAQKAVEAGLLRPIDGQKPKATWKAVLAIEEWLVGKDTRDAVVERTQQIDSAPISDGTPKKAKKKKGSGNSKKTRAIKPSAKTPPAGVAATPKGDIDWGALVPRVIGAEVGPLSGVVPALGTHGEIEEATRDKPREGLEALMDTDKRTKIFATDIGLEPSVVVKGGDTDEWERVELEARTRVEADAAAKAADEKAAADKVAADKAAADKVAADKAAADKVAADKAAADKVAADKAAADAEAKHAHAEAEAKAKAKAESARAASAAAEEAKAYAAKVKAAADAKRLGAETAAGEKLAAEKAAIAKAKAERLAAEEAAAAETAAAEKAAAEKAAVEKAAAETAAAETSAAAKAAWEAADRAEARDQAAAAMVATPIAASETASAAMIAKPLAPVEPPLSRDDIVTKETPPLTISETLSTTITVADKLTVVAKADTAHLSATPTVTIIETPAPTAIPGALDISPSDGIVRPISTADTAPAGRGRLPSAPPAHDGPVLKETSGELGGGKRSEPTPASSEPSILVSDLQAAHAAAAAVLDKVKAAPPPGDSASASRELEVAQTRKELVATTDAEEAFFNRAERPSQPKIETFDDLDEGYEKPSFWDRVFGRKPKKKL